MLFEVGLFTVVNISSYRKYDSVYCFYTDKVRSIDLYSCVRGCVHKESKGNVSIISQNSQGLKLIDFEIKHQSTVVETNYNDDTVKQYYQLKNELNRYDSESLVIMHSSPGCGKTSLIRKLISDTDKEFVFVPNNLIEMFINPSFMDFAMNNLRDCVVIIEDAESILTSRKSAVNPYVSTILNLTDGLMKDLLNIKIICTINNDINTIDEALMRKGRLLMKMELGLLNKDKSSKLLKKLGSSYTTDEPMKLCDIYNIEKDSFQEEKKKIGFGS